MSNNPYTDGAINSQPQQPDPAAAQEWNGGYTPQQPDMGQGYPPQQPDMGQGYPPQQPQQMWNGGYPPQDPGMNQGYQQPPYQGAYQQPPQQAPYQNGYQQAPYQGAYQQPSYQGAYQQPPYQGRYQQPQPPRQPRVTRSSNPANNVVKLPRFIKKEKLPFLVKTLLCAFPALMLLNFINDISLANTVWPNQEALKILSCLLALGGGACLALGPILKKPLIAAIGAFVTAVGVLLAGIGYIVTPAYSLRWMDVVGGSLMILSAGGLVVVGLNYVLHGQGINAMIKRIACYAGFGCAALGLILTAIPAISVSSLVMNSARTNGVNLAKYSALYGILNRQTITATGGVLTSPVLWLLFTLAGAAVLAGGLFLYNPGMSVFQETAPKAEKAPLQLWRATSMAKILAAVFTGCALVALVFSIIAFKFTTFFAILLWLAAGVMMLLGTLMSRKCEFLYAIGVFLAAAGALVFMYADSWYGALLLLVQVLCLGGIGIHYLFQSRMISEKWKNLLTYVGLGIGGAMCLFHIIMQVVDLNSLNTIARGIFKFDVIVMIQNIFILFTTVALFLAILFYKPFTTPRGYSPTGFPGGYPGGYPAGGYPNANPNGYPNENGGNSGNGGNGAPY